MANYRLNALLTQLPMDSEIVIGTSPYTDPESLHAMRAELRATHFVKRRGEFVDTVPYDTGVAAVGDVSTIRLERRYDLVQGLTREWLARSMQPLHVRRERGGGINYVSQRDDSNLLLQSLFHGLKLPAGVGRRIAADFDVRRIRDRSGQTRFVVTIDIRTKITIDCPVDALLGLGLDPIGLYVQEVLQDSYESYRRLAGRVVGLDGPNLALDPNDSRLERLPTSAALLEPRQENLDRVIKAIAGRLADRVIENLKQRVAERTGGKERPRLIGEWVKKIRSFPRTVVQGVSLKVAQDVLRTDTNQFPQNEIYTKPQLVFDVGRTKTDSWNQQGLDRFGPFNFERFSPKRLKIAVICQATRQGDVEHFIAQLLDGVPNSKYAEKGLVRRYHLERPQISTFTSMSASATDYRSAVLAAIDDSTSRDERWDLALIQTDESFHELTGDQNPYLVTKAIFLSHQVPSQAFEWESIRPGMVVDITINNIGLAIYAKVNGTPWLLPVHQAVAHELVVGIGSFELERSRFHKRERYIGVTTVFSADGRYILESRTPATPADEYLQVLLRALERVLGEVRGQQAWSDDQPVRLIFHVFKDFQSKEIDAVQEVVRGLRLRRVEFAFVHLVEDHPFMVFDIDQDGLRFAAKKGAGAPPRGLRVDLTGGEALVCLKGPRELRQWSDGSPKPILLRLHPASTFKDLSYLARQVFDFTCLSWRTLLPAPIPISVHYSDLIAEKLLLLRGVTGWSPDAVLGPVGRGRWFL